MAAILLWTAGCILLLMLLIYVKWRLSVIGRAAQVLKKFPGPPANPIFEMTRKVIYEWFPFYGSPMKLLFGPFPSVQIFRADHVEAALKSVINIRKSRDYHMLADWLGHGLLISDGEKWHSRRKLLTPAFHFQILRSFLPVINENAAHLIRVLQHKSTDEVFDISPYFSLSALDIICETAMGKRIYALENQNSVYVTAITELSAVFLHRCIRPWLWPNVIFYNVTAGGRKMKKYLTILHNFTKQVIDEREQERHVFVNNDKHDLNEKLSSRRRVAFLDLLLNLKDEGQLDYQDVREEVDTFMFEGHDTTATALKWVCYWLGRYPQIQQKARQEMQSLLGIDVSVWPTTEHLGRMMYLDCCIKESQRIYPPVPVIMRVLDEPLQIDNNYILPIGTSLNINFAGLHQDPEYFPDPMKFDPDRFLPENALGRHPFAFTPFSAGLRNCIGQKFAVMEEKVILCHLLRSYSWVSVQNPENMEPAVLFVMRPSNGVLVKLQTL